MLNTAPILPGSWNGESPGNAFPATNSATVSPNPAITPVTTRCLTPIPGGSGKPIRDATQENSVTPMALPTINDDSTIIVTHPMLEKATPALAKAKTSRP